MHILVKIYVFTISLIALLSRVPERGSKRSYLQIHDFKVTESPEKFTFFILYFLFLELKENNAVNISN